MQIRDRIKELRRVRADQLRPHPRNWRTHPAAQADALKGVLAEIGYADALLARELADGSLQLVDGHLRAEVSGDTLVPVLVVDLDDDEALKLLATLDPLSAMAGADGDLLAGLLADVSTGNEAVRALLDSLAAETPSLADQAGEAADALDIPQAFQLVIECADEVEQRGLYERLSADGFKCRVLSL
jgi:ParB-like chromosome segregation protein Spo0J